MCSKLSYLKSFLDESSYTVALCGSGMMEEGGFIGVKKQERDYEIETAYGYSADEIFSSAFYNTRPELFFEFYKKEMLEHAPRATQSSPAMASLEHLGKLNCVVCSNIYDQARLAGCKNVINLHGSIYESVPALQTELSPGIHQVRQAGSAVRDLRHPGPPPGQPVRRAGGQPADDPDHGGGLQG